MPATLKLFAYWPGERAAGIRSGYEDVTIELKYSDTFEPEDVEAFRETVSEMFMCAQVLTEAEQDAEHFRQLAQEPADDLLTRIGQRIYDAYNVGALSYDIAEASLETLDQLTGDNLWLGMPIIPEPAD